LHPETVALPTAIRERLGELLNLEFEELDAPVSVVALRAYQFEVALQVKNLRRESGNLRIGRRELGTKRLYTGPKLGDRAIRIGQPIDEHPLLSLKTVDPSTLISERLFKLTLGGGGFG